MSGVPEHRSRGLGRGLEVLIGGAGEAELLHLPVEAIHANPRQPRRRFEPEATAGLAASIKSQGVLQPVVVRPSTIVSSIPATASSGFSRALTRLIEPSSCERPSSA